MINRSGVALACLGSAILFYLILIIGYSAVDTKNGSETTDVLVFGDSVFGECRDETGIVNILATSLGENVLNCSIGGTCMTKSRDSRAAYTMDTLSMFNLAVAMESEDFGPQKTFFNRISVLYYEKDVLESLQTLDYSRVKKVILCYGLNDYHQGVTVKNDEDPEDINTFFGAYSATVKRLEKLCPKAEIILVTSPFSWYPAYGDDKNCENMDFGGGYLIDYVEATQEIGEKYSLKVVDLYHTQYGARAFYDRDIYTNDGLHPNELGRGNIARTVFKKIRE